MEYPFNFINKRTKKRFKHYDLIKKLYLCIIKLFSDEILIGIYRINIKNLLK